MDPFQEVASQRLSLGLRVPQGRRFQRPFTHTAWEGLGRDMGDCEGGWAVAWEQHQGPQAVKEPAPGSQQVTRATPRPKGWASPLPQVQGLHSRWGPEPS